MLRTVKFKLFRKDQLSLNYVADRVAMVLRLEGRRASHEFEDGDSEGPHVYHFVVASALEHLRSSIVRSAC